MTYKTEFKGKWKIIYVDSKILKDYAGMNHYAGKILGFKPKLGKNIILIDKNQSKLTQKRNILHEITEAKLMYKNMTYWTAHKKALKEEKKIK